MSEYQYGRLGIGVGMIYELDPTASEIWFQYPNDAKGARQLRLSAQRSQTQSLGGEGTVIGRVTLGAPGDSIDTFVIDGVNQIGAPVPFNTDDAITAADLVAAINAFSPPSGPNYRSQAVATYLVTSTGLIGSTWNGAAVTFTTTGTITIGLPTPAVISGGGDPGATVSPVYGRVYYIDSSSSAVEGTVSGSDVTELVIRNLIQMTTVIQTVTNSGTAILVTRKGPETYVVINSTGVAAPVRQITMPYVALGDRIIAWGYQAANSALFKDVSATGAGPNDNIYTQRAADYLSETAKDVIELIYLNDPLTGLGWYEYDRANQNVVIVNDLRATDIPQPVTGTQLHAINVAGEIITLTAATTPGTLLFTAGGVLLGNVSIVGAGTPKDNEKWIIRPRPGIVINIGAFNLSIFGVNLPLQTGLSGIWYAEAVYDLAAAAYRVNMFQDARAVAAITSSQINSLNGAKLEAASIPAGAYGPLSITGPDIAAGAVDLSKLSASVAASVSENQRLNYLQLNLTTGDIATSFTVPIALGLPVAPNIAHLAQACLIEYTFGGVAFAGGLDAEIAAAGVTVPQLTCVGVWGVGASRQFMMAQAGGSNVTAFAFNADLQFREPLVNPGGAGTGSAIAHIWYLTLTT